MAWYSPETIAQLSHHAQEPSWLKQLRTTAWTQHAKLAWPNAGDEVWRRTDLKAFHPDHAGVSGDVEKLLLAKPKDPQRIQPLIAPVGSEYLLARADGAWVTQRLPDGLYAADLARAAQERPEIVKPILEADGLTPEEQKLASLNTAFHHDALFVHVPPGVAWTEPVRLVRLRSVWPNLALFPMTVIVVGEGSSVSFVEEDIGIDGASSGPHTINERIELIVQSGAKVRYCRIQRWAPGAQEFLIQRASVQRDAELSLVNLNLGGQLSKTHVIAKLLGEGAVSRVFGFVFGHDQQHIDFHSLQDHQAPRTMSDLLYKAALKDESRMIYTGLIRIAKAAQQTDAYQANHNLLLSQQANAETIPMLEILADDVRCKHGATVGPVDEEQLFYLQARGIPRTLAERLLVMGFVDPIIDQVPGEVFQQRLRDELANSLG